MTPEQFAYVAVSMRFVAASASLAVHAAEVESGEALMREIQDIATKMGEIAAMLSEPPAGRPVS